MSTSIKFSNGYVLSAEKIDEVVKVLFEVLKKLPDEALNFEVLNYISTEIIRKK